MKSCFTLLLSLVVLLLSSCLGIAPTADVQRVDYLNQRAYAVRYTSLDSLGIYSHAAYIESDRYKLGKAKACNHLGFYAFMKMDFELATQYYQEVADHTINELELLIADVGLMKITQRTASNKSFYDYRNSALQRMKRIDEDKSVFETTTEKQRLNYAYSEFYIVSAIYFYYLQQKELALEALNKLDQYKTDALLWNSSYTDLNQLLYFKYIKGATGSFIAPTADQRKLNSFDELLQTWLIATEIGSVYFEANAAQGIANILLRPADFELIQKERSLVLNNMGFDVDSLLPLRLGQYALNKFKSYNDLYQIAGTYVTVGKYHNYRGEYAEALQALTQALNCVNKHHQSFYKDHHDSPDNLKPYDKESTEIIEFSWIEDEVLTVPDWISRIREQLSVTYAGLENKVASDYNRNIYLDILDFVRQDKELEGRYQYLQQEESKVNNLLGLLLIVLILFIFLIVFVNRHSRKRTANYLSRLERTLTVCRELTASLPTHSKGLMDVLKPIGEILAHYLKRELDVECIVVEVHYEQESETFYSQVGLDTSQLKSNLFSLTQKRESPVQGELTVYLNRKLSKEERGFIAILSPYMVWAIENGLLFMDLGEEQEVLEKRRFITNQHNIDHKRENIMKRASMRIVYGIQPYIDRIINEVDKIENADYTLDQTVRQSKYDYIIELLQTIDEYNAVLAEWIKIKQGELRLDITNFNLGELFDLVAKGGRPFEQKGVNLKVEPISVYLKADRALTLFMINTLIENGRKFTLPGGEVKLYAEEYDDFVEVVIEDTGVGMSVTDVGKILGEKVYDSKEIGEDQAAVSENKGSGFGLMNCKAIIEEYRKTNPLFSVCTFKIESELNKGSRFSFRLPLGLKKTLLTLLLIVAPWLFSACSNDLTPNASKANIDNYVELDSIKLNLLQEASDFADAAYYSNVDLDYEKTLVYVDSAIQKLNSYYRAYSYYKGPLLKIRDEEGMAEVVWWNQQFATNYHIILDIRNEAAIAYLALKNIDDYNYNNSAYTTLYKLISKDDTLDKYCKVLERSTSNKRVALVLLSLLVVIILFSYYILYVRRQLLRRWSLERVLGINERIFTASLFNETTLEKSPEQLREIPLQIIESIYNEINELLAVDAIGICLINQEKQSLFTSFTPQAEEPSHSQLEEAIQTKEWLTFDREEFIPLEVSMEAEEQKVIGVFYIKRREAIAYQEERLFIRLITRYLATVLHNSMIRTASRFRDIEMVFDEMHRLAWENSQIHVQNRVLDNCLSALKHETIYYPSRLKQVVLELKDLEIGESSEVRERASMVELIEYYKGVYTILSLWAKKELEEVTFRRTTISVAELAHWTVNLFERRAKRMKSSIELLMEVNNDLEIVGDEKLVYYLVELLTTDALAQKGAGTITWSIQEEDKFVLFNFKDSRNNYSVEELNNLFYPNLAAMVRRPNEGFQGSTFLIAKEIIREHDEYVGRRGCRIWITPLKEGGYQLCFTLARKENIRG